jgi:hypothetical protein
MVRLVLSETSQLESSVFQYNLRRYSNKQTTIQNWFLSLIFFKKIRSNDFFRFRDLWRNSGGKKEIGRIMAVRLQKFTNVFMFNWDVFFLSTEIESFR